MLSRRRFLQLLSLAPVPTLFIRTTPTEPWVRDHPPPIDSRTREGIQAIHKMGLEIYMARAYFRRGSEWCVRKTRPHVVGGWKRTGPNSWSGPRTDYLAYGPGVGIDPATLAENGKRYPSWQFKIETPPDPWTEPRGEIRLR
jgi:hypothetical protein